MNLTIILWLMVWGGIYTDVSYIKMPWFLSDTSTFIHGTRAFLPILAGFLSLLIIRKSGSEKPGPLLALVVYGLIGGLFFFLSPMPFTSMYWAAMFLSVPLVARGVIKLENPYEQAHLLNHINWSIAVLMTAFFLLGPLWPILHGEPNPRLYTLPFGLGAQTANGVGRFVGIASLIALSRLRRTSLRNSLFWLIVLAGSIVALALSESRTAMLSFGLGSLFLIWISRKRWWMVVGAPGVIYLLWLSWFQWRAEGSVENAFFMTGREYVWKRAVEMWLQSPLYGFGFHADRYMLEGEHIHNAYLHSLIQSGILGSIFFLGAVIGVWILILQRNLFKEIPKIGGDDKFLLVESIAILVFLTARSFFESTAAFYGVDLLFFVPVVAYIQVWIRKNPQQREAQEERALVSNFY